MDADECWWVIAAERLRLADLLAELPASRWETPSLCAGWQVRDVASHLILGASPLPWPTRLAWTLRTGGRFHKLNHAVAVAHAARPTADIVADLRHHASSRRLPVPLVTDHLTTLLDVLVHTQDIAIPLGIPHQPPVRAARAAARQAWTMTWPFWARHRLRGIHLHATDANLDLGTGLTVEGPILALLLLLTSRSTALPSLTGPGITLINQRVRPG
jgi:uncharacterized protein (TIGR03083 family)